MKEPAIKIESLTIGYEGKGSFLEVAHQINASVYAGELTSLIGPNGVGKSTLLRTLSKLQPSYEGRITLYGENLQEIRKERLATLLSVVLTERPSIYNISVKEMVAMGRNPYTNYWGTLSQKDERVIAEALEMVGIMDLSARKFETLSDGEKQKVMIAKALAQQTPIILLDEPTSFLDYPSKIELMQLLYRLTHEMQKTILFSTHDLDLAMQVCDKMALMSSKEIIIGTPEDLSLNHQLSEFMSGKGMLFDYKTGLFKVKHPIQWGIRSEGNGASYVMLKKALLRKGVLSHEDIKSNAFITVSDKGYVLHTVSGKTLSAHSIEEMLSIPEVMQSVIPLSEQYHHKE